MCVVSRACYYGVCVSSMLHAVHYASVGTSYVTDSPLLCCLQSLLLAVDSDNYRIFAGNFA